MTTILFLWVGSSSHALCSIQIFHKSPSIIFLSFALPLISLQFHSLHSAWYHKFSLPQLSAIYIYTLHIYTYIYMRIDSHTHTYMYVYLHSSGSYLIYGPKTLWNQHLHLKFLRDLRNSSCVKLKSLCLNLLYRGLVLLHCWAKNPFFLGLFLLLVFPTASKKSNHLILWVLSSKYFFEPIHFSVPFIPRFLSWFRISWIIP